MIKEVAIRNFRCFQSSQVQRCKRLNVVVGTNASGKTAFLEALFLASSSRADTPFRFRGWRGFEPSVTGATFEIATTIWSDLFYNYDTTLPISISFRGTDDKTRSVELTAIREPLLVSVEEPAAETGSRVPLPLKIIWKQGNRDPQEATLRVLPSGKIELSQVEPAPFEAMFFSSKSLLFIYRGGCSIL